MRVRQSEIKWESENALKRECSERGWNEHKSEWERGRESENERERERERGRMFVSEQWVGE